MIATFQISAHGLGLATTGEHVLFDAKLLQEALIHCLRRSPVPMGLLLSLSPTIRFGETGALASALPTWTGERPLRLAFLAGANEHLAQLGWECAQLPAPHRARAFTSAEAAMAWLHAQ